MLEFNFFLTQEDDELTGYELGGLEINSGTNHYKLLDKKYYFMVFVFVSDFLDGISKFYNQEKDNISFWGADSSFCIKIKRVNQKEVELYILDELIDKFSKAEFKTSVFEGCKKFIQCYKDRLDLASPVCKDLERSLNDCYLF